MRLPFGKQKPLTNTQERLFEKDVITVKDIVAPAVVKIDSEYLDVGGRLAVSFFVFSYPRYLVAGWLAPVINMDVPMDIAMFCHPVDTGMVLKQLRRKVTEVESELIEIQDKGMVRDPALETGFQDLETLRDRLQTAQEKMFRLGLYLTIYGETAEDLLRIKTQLRSIFESRLLYIKPSLYQQKEGFNSTIPYGLDLLQIHTTMNTGPLSSIFPFISFDLSSNEGILYGINRHNNSLILFDRFSLENANEVIFAKSGSGKSILGSEPVLVRQDGKTALLPIQKVVDGLIEKRGATKIDEELEGVIDPGLQVYSFDKNMKAAWSPVTVAARKQAPDLFYKFRTQSGREITTTGDHNMLVLRNGEVAVVKSTDVKKGEYIPIPRAVADTADKKSTHIDLLDLLKDERKVYVSGGQEIIQRHYKILAGKTVDSRFDKYLSKYKAGRSIPLHYFKKIVSVLGGSPNSLEKVWVVSKNGKSKYQLFARFPITKEFLRILGYITSEGTVRKDVVIITNTDREVLQDIEYALTSIGIPFYYGDRNIIIASPVFAAIVRTLGCGGKSSQKRVPPFIFSLDNEHTASYLSAYFEGDGGVENNNSVTATSKSPNLISDLSYLLLKFGIICRIAKTKKRATNTNWVRKKTYYKLTISGQDNLRRFAQFIGFVSEAKRERLREGVMKQGNTNVDIVPETAPLLQEIDRLFGFQLHGVQNFSPLKRGVFHPSREMLCKLIGDIEIRIKQFKDSAPSYDALAQLPSLDSVIYRGTQDRKLNRALWKTLGQSWRTAKTENVSPYARNALKMIKVVNNQSYSLADIKQNIYSGFQEMDLLMNRYDRSLQSALVARPESNTSYETLWRASRFVWQNYERILTENMPLVEQRIAQLKALASSDLFWDPIVKIEESKNTKEKYVYDLTVDNEVFLAGRGGMFVHNSYAVKLEILRSVMTGVDVIVLDPENEYKTLAQGAGGSFFDISLSSENHINPFDLPMPREDESADDVLRSNIINLVGLMRLMLGGLTPEEDAIMDRALTETYAAKDITASSDPKTWNAKVPVMADLEQVLATMEGADSLVRRLGKFTTGTYSSFFNQQSNISMENKVVVFGIRDMEEGLRPLAMYMMMRYVWNKVRSELKKRILVVDEAWWIMKSDDGASFLYGMAKRARKYYLGVTTITQDVGDFMRSEYGKPIITNSSLQLLLKQSPATIDLVQKAFNLTDAERSLLLETELGEGIFFAGQKHVAVKVVASPREHEIVTTSPKEILEQRARKESLE